MQTAFEVPASQRDTQLPMIINLQGDEDIIEDFTFDAEQAMEYLGIKRSRLTQISGRELRVGRIRRDRYLRPVYRECDLRDYQDWTRATATHQTSSRAIEQAIDSLDDRFNDLFVVLQEKLQQSQSQSKVILDRSFSRLQDGFRREQLSAAERMENSQQLVGLRLEKNVLQLHRLQLEDLKQQSSLFELAQQTEQRLAQYHQDLRELIAAMVLLRKELQDHQDLLQKAWEPQFGRLEQAILDLQKPWEESRQNFEHTITKCFQQLSERLVEVVQAKSGEVVEEVLPSTRRIIRRRDMQRRRPYNMRP